MFRVAICDDEPAEVRKVEGCVREYDDFDVSGYTSSLKLAQDLEDGAVFDLYLLDVIMPKPDGIELARIVRNLDATAAIIYLTSHDGRALDAYRVRASQYLTKPVERETLRRELDAALAAAKKRSAKVFLLKTKNGTEVWPFHRIAYCELDGRAVSLVTADGEKQRSVTLRAPFDEAMSPLLAERRFIRPHMSYVVNMDFVTSFMGASLVMKNGETIPVAHRAAAEIKERYLKYFFKSDDE